MEPVDTHVHVIVPELLRERAPDQDWRPAVSRTDGRPVIEFGGRQIRNMVNECMEIEGILATQERAGIRRVLLCPWVPLLFLDLPAGEALQRCAVQNAGLARMRAGAPERVSVLGAVPLQDPELAAGELREMMAAGDFAGVEVTASVAGAYLGDERFEPFWVAAEETGALVFVHPTTRGFDHPVFQERYLWNLVGNPMETTVAASQMVLNGTLERHPELRVLLAHGGGALVWLRGRLRHGHAVIGPAGGGLSEAPEESIRRFRFDTVTHDPEVLRTLVETVGSDRVLLGSDYPFDMADPDPVGTVRAAGLSPEDEQAILARSAERLLGLAPTIGSSA
jgi:aminocarboxymuconate-semialdehyde decarboxylase